MLVLLTSKTLMAMWKLFVSLTSDMYSMKDGSREGYQNYKSCFVCNDFDLAM